jgi:inosine/xanthosine triphosphatase
MKPALRIALGSLRAAKVEALRAALSRIATIDARWGEAEIIALAVDTRAPAMPLTDLDLILGARARAQAVRESLEKEGRKADYFVGLEGGFHSITLEGEMVTFLRGWACVTDGSRQSLGCGPSITVPRSIVRSVIEGRRELGVVIDEVAGQSDVRSRQGAWGVLSLDLLTRAASFESALVAAFAPFYNERMFQ